MTLLFRLTISLAILLGVAMSARASDITLAWDANTEPDVIGYWVVYRTSAQSDWTQSVDVGNQTTYTVTGLTPGTTYVFAVMAYSSSGLHSDASQTVSASIPAITTNSDFDGDGYNDLLWQNRDDGSLIVWRMQGIVTQQVVALSPASRPDLNWEIAGVADVNHDGKPDIIWYNHTTGALEAWLMNGFVMQSAVPFNPGARVDPNWRIVSVIDVDGDGNPDLVWRNLATGNIECWRMNGVNMIESLVMEPGLITDPNWQITGMFDVNGDGHPDQIWFHKVTGVCIAILMNGTHMLDSAYMDPSQINDHNWIFAAYTDINGDGKTDMVWQHATAPNYVIGVLLNGLHMLDSSYLQPMVAPGPNWRLAGPR